MENGIKIQSRLMSQSCERLKIRMESKHNTDFRRFWTSEDWKIGSGEYIEATMWKNEDEEWGAETELIDKDKHVTV